MPWNDCSLVQPLNTDNPPLSNIDIQSTSSSSRSDRSTPSSSGSTSLIANSSAPTTLAFPLLDGDGNFDVDSPPDSLTLEKARQLYQELYQIAKDKIPDDEWRQRESFPCSPILVGTISC